MRPELPPVYLQDYIIALVINEEREALVWERERPDGGTYWQMLESFLAADADPFTAVQDVLFAYTGRQTMQWSYLGSHVVDTSEPTGVGYFFCAQAAYRVEAEKTIVLLTAEGLALQPKWISLTDLRYALLDGRLAMTRHALAVSLALLTILK